MSKGKASGIDEVNYLSSCSSGPPSSLYSPLVLFFLLLVFNVFCPKCYFLNGKYGHIHINGVLHLPDELFKLAKVALRLGSTPFSPTSYTFNFIVAN